MKIKPCCDWMKLSIEKGIILIGALSLRPIIKNGNSEIPGYNFKIDTCMCCWKKIELIPEEPEKPDRLEVFMLKERAEEISKLCMTDELAETNKAVNKLADRIESLEKKLKEAECK